MTKSEHPFIRLFMGENDAEELTALQEHRRRQGWTLAADTMDPRYTRAMRRTKRATVVINGFATDACVAFAAHDAMEGHARRVVVQLENTMTDTEGDEPLLTRARRFFGVIPARHAVDPRLVVTPEDVADQARRERGLRRRKGRSRRHHP